MVFFLQFVCRWRKIAVFSINKLSGHFSFFSTIVCSVGGSTVFCFTASPDFCQLTVMAFINFVT